MSGLSRVVLEMEPGLAQEVGSSPTAGLGPPVHDRRAQEPTAGVGWHVGKDSSTQEILIIKNVSETNSITMNE